MDKRFGWLDKPIEVDKVLSSMRHPVFCCAAGSIKDSGKGKVARLWKACETVMGKVPLRVQDIGDCVSMSYALCADVLACVEIVLKKEKEEYKEEAATEPIYGGSRVEIGGGQLGNDDGSVGAWAAKWVQEYGILSRRIYKNGKEYDLRKYSGDRAKEWGYQGVPDILEPIARKHPVRTYSLVTTYEGARDSIANGYPIPVCSNQGFEGKRGGETIRDADGFAAPRGSWGHAMSFIGMDDEFKRPGLLCCNSWPVSWISGPKRHEQPEGSFWVDADVADRMLRQNDSFALSGFEGYPAQTGPDYILI